MPAALSRCSPLNRGCKPAMHLLRLQGTVDVSSLEQSSQNKLPSGGKCCANHQSGVQLGMLLELPTLGWLSNVQTCTGTLPSLSHPGVCHSCRYGPRPSPQDRYLEGQLLHKYPHGVCVNNVLPVVIFAPLEANNPFLCQQLQSCLMHL